MRVSDWIVQICVLATIACSGEDRAPPVGNAGTSQNSATGGTEVGGNGSGGSTASGNGSGGSVTSKGGSSATGGESGSAGAQGGEGVVLPPIDLACSGDRAFTAISGAFVDPTPPDLALALDRATFGKSPFAVVLRAAGSAPTLAVSYTITAGEKQRFPANLTPEFTRAWLADGGFGSVTAQEAGWLRVMLDSGPLEVPLRNLSVYATTRDSCTQAIVSVSAEIPGDNLDLVAKIVGTEPEQEPPDDVSAEQVPVRAVFLLELSDFNFETLP